MADMVDSNNPVLARAERASRLASKLAAAWIAGGVYEADEQNAAWEELVAARAEEAAAWRACELAQLETSP
jgi:hypothetical protein